MEKHSPDRAETTAAYLFFFGIVFLGGAAASVRIDFVLCHLALCILSIVLSILVHYCEVILPNRDMFWTKKGYDGKY